MGKKEQLAEELEAALLAIDQDACRHIIMDDMADVPILSRIENAIVPALASIGVKWRNGDVALSQVYLSAKITDALLEEMLSSSHETLASRPKVAAVCLEDHHLLGIHVVRMVVRSSGYDVVDYGRMDLEPLVERVCRDEVDYLLISTLMLRSALRVEKLKEKLEERKCDACLIVGGAPFRYDASLWRRVGADFTSSSPSEALEFILSREGKR
ncbi:MAG: Dimethylamine corrinoid protein [Methanomassiliicoccales archaeon PtaU1.Bin124]|nr:MAG: Dimethylamine corrinoid protein [Methanomassiliicoccales archaeon PtaU1.Bin124]